MFAGLNAADWINTDLAATTTIDIRKKWGHFSIVSRVVVSCVKSDRCFLISHGSYSPNFHSSSVKTQTGMRKRDNQFLFFFFLGSSGSVVLGTFCSKRFFSSSYKVQNRHSCNSVCSILGVCVHG